jgi:hypothetical protein
MKLSNNELHILLDALDILIDTDSFNDHYAAEDKDITHNFISVLKAALLRPGHRR